MASHDRLDAGLHRRLHTKARKKEPPQGAKEVVFPGCQSIKQRTASKLQLAETKVHVVAK